MIKKVAAPRGRTDVGGVFTRCVFCTGDLGRNEEIEHFTVGRRLAFDAARGRLWVVCPGCARWNLTPLEERWEAIEECERRFRATTARLSTDNVGLARLRDGLELIRIGKPLRPEFAAWRYAGSFGQRQRQAAVSYAAGIVGTTTVSAAGITAAAALSGSVFAATASGPLGIVIVPAMTYIFAALPLASTLAARDHFREERVLARFVGNGRVIKVRQRDLTTAELTSRHGESRLRVPGGGEWMEFSGTEALQATGAILAGANWGGGPRRIVRDAVAQIESAGTSERFVEAAARRSTIRQRPLLNVMNRWSGRGAFRLAAAESFALEMAVNEEAERRALEGELHALEKAWRDAEEIAAIADRLPENEV
jgi:hypothetical protein